MNLGKIASLKKISLFLASHTLLFGGIFALRIFGLTTELILFTLAGVVFLEVIYLTIYTQASVNKSVQSLAEVKKNTEGIMEDEVKIHTALIHIGHQMSTVQHDLDLFKKNGLLKNGNGHAKKMYTL